MHPVQKCLRGTVVSLTVLGLLLAGSPQADARWNPQKFGRTLKWADKAFTDGRYAKAQELYTEARAELQASLDGGEIEEGQQEKAKFALGTLDYQLARTVQLSEGCHAGYLAFKELRSTDRLEFAVGVKVEVRMAETLLCRAKTRMAEGDIARAQGDVEQAGALLAATGERRMHMALTEEQADDVRLSLEQAADQLVKALVGLETWGEGECGVVHEMSRVGDRLPTGVVISGIEGLRTRLVQSCGPSPTTTPVVDDKPPSHAPEASVGSELVRWGPWILMGLGWLGWLGAGINEIRLIPTVDEFRSARSDCESRGDRCTEALLLSTDVESGQFLSTTLGISGAVLVGAGLAWWLWPEDGESTGAVMLMPLEGGAMVGGRLELD